MDQIDWWPWIKRAGYVLLASLVLALVVGGTYGQTAAAWAQAIGTVAAIAGAAWVSHGEARRAKVADEAETRAFVDAVHAELNVMYRIFRADAFNPLLELQKLEQPKPLALRYPIRQSVFVVYPAGAARVGKIDDPDLRTLIVKTYDRAAQILHAMSILHKLTLDRDAPKVGQPQMVQIERDDIHADMLAFTNRLRLEGEVLADNMTMLTTKIDEWKARQR